jgi:hypothetical protein
LQLIEIIQIVLLIFIVLSAIIFLSSYLGYKSKSKLKDFPKLKNEVKKTHQHQFQVVKDLDKNPEIEKPKESVKQNQLFEVFAPNSDRTISLDEKKSIAKKSHSPKTLIIKPKS